MFDTLPTGLLAQASESAAALPPELDLWRYLALSGLVIALVVGAALLLPRLTRGALRQRAKRRSLVVLDLLPLGGRRQLAVVRVYDRTFLLGLGDKDVRLVSELDAEPEPGTGPSSPVRAGSGAALAGTPPAPDFLARLAKSMRSDPVPPAGRGAAARGRAELEPEPEPDLELVLTPEPRRAASVRPSRAGAGAPATGRTVAELLRGEGVLG